MCNNNSSVNWEKVISLYNAVKDLYALCEEVDPELNTNLQPLNEFRAALDHLMRICAINHLDEYKEQNAVDEFKSLYGHLKRAFFDICDLLTLHYRNKIIDLLEAYDKEDIQCAIPTYYSEIRPFVEKTAKEISIVRTGSRFGKGDNFIDAYYSIIEKLSGYYSIVIKTEPSLIELKERRIKKEKKNQIIQIVIPVASIVIGATIGIIGIIY